MAFLQWRRFTFFDKEVLKCQDGDSQFDKLKEFDVTTCTSGRGHIICGDGEGYCHIITRQLEILTFRAFDRHVLHVHQVRQSGILVCVGEDDEGINPLIKVFSLDKKDYHGIPICTQVLRAVYGNNPSPVTVIAVPDNNMNLAVGFQNGNVILYKGDVARERYNSKPKLCHEDQNPISGLIFRTMGRYNHLFVVTTNDIYSYNLLSKENEKCHVDSLGCPPRCVTMTDSKQDSLLVVARKEAVYFYQPDGRGPCLGFEGEKLIIHWFRGYFIVIGRDNRNTSSQPSTSDGPPLEMNVVTIYDVHNKFIAYSAPVPEVIDVISEWGSLFILSKDKKLYCLHERDTQNKLETLFKKNLYEMAIQLAKSQQYDEDGLVDIFRQYGDHLYNKGDHDGAINQYIKTIGKLEASYVIRKFLDAQRIHNLTAYLQELHKKGLATEDHTTLLLNCYTKLKDIQKLDEFIMTKDREIDFDVDTAIKVCRQAGYFRHALSLAERHHQHDWYLKIQLEDQKDYHKALEYIGKLEFKEAEQNMKKYGKILLQEVPEKTTDFLKGLCTDYTPNDKPLVDDSTLDGSRNVETFCSSAEEFIHIFVNNTEKLTEFLEHMIRVKPSCQSAVYNTLIEVYLREYHKKKESEQEQRNWEQKIMEMLQQPESGYDIDQALVLCQVSNFRPGILYLYEKAKLYQQILRYHMDHQDYASIVVTCKKFGSHDSNLWIQALRFLVHESANEHCYLNEVLLTIEKKKLLPPLMVVDIMASSPTVNLGSIKDYMIRHLQQENSRIADDERLIKQYQEETEKMRTQIEEIKTSARIFQVSKCSACNHTLELPSVHFLCQHSYHQHCFESYVDSESECIVCLPENKKVLDTIRAQEQSRELHEHFHHQLERAEDGFSVVAEYFGRGVFNNVTLMNFLPPKQKLPPTGIPKLQIGLPSQNTSSLSRNTNPFSEYDNRLNPFEV